MHSSFYSRFIKWARNNQQVFFAIINPFFFFDSNNSYYFMPALFYKNSKKRNITEYKGNHTGLTEQWTWAQVSPEVVPICLFRYGARLF